LARRVSTSRWRANATAPTRRLTISWRR
jgi:hypothetical protein